MKPNVLSVPVLGLCLALLCTFSCNNAARNSHNGDTGTRDAAKEKETGEASQVKIVFNSGQKFEFSDATTLGYCRNLISPKPSPAYKCGYNGTISYIKGDSVLLEAEFNLDKDCRHVAFMEGDSLQTREMGLEGFRFLQGLRSGRDAEGAGLNELTWLLGRWQQIEAAGVYSFEDWTRDNGQHFTGQAYTLQDGDTAFSETLQLVQEADGIYYIPTVPANQGPVRFKMTSLGKSSAVFENPLHDFPQTIAYKVTEDSILHARISGTRVGPDGQKESGFKDFFMQRVR